MPPGTDLIDRYFEADRTHDVEAIVGLFTPAGVVIDEGTTHRGTCEIRDWRDGATSRYDYTTTQVARRSTADDGAVVVARLDGNFPGGTVNLQFAFEVTDTLIASLTIAPTSDPTISDPAVTGTP